MSMPLSNSAVLSNLIYAHFSRNYRYFIFLIICRSAEEAVPAMRKYYDGHDILVDFIFGSLKKYFQRDAYGSDKWCFLVLFIH